MDTDQDRNAGLPIRCDLTLSYALSLAIAILMAMIANMEKGVYRHSDKELDTGILRDEA